MKKINFSDHIGKKTNRLTFLKEVEPKITSGGNKKRMAEASCECGVIKNYEIASVLAGITKSCGCYGRESASNRAFNRNLKHGMYGTPEYECWSAMKKRCLNKNHKSYKDYGGRGIKISESWLDFNNFFRDMGERPIGKTSIDRSNVNGDYEYGNCHWATSKDQTRNQRSNRLIKYKGDIKCLGEWCDLLLIDYSRTYYRIFIAKWDIEKAFS